MKKILTIAMLGVIAAPFVAEAAGNKPAQRFYLSGRVGGGTVSDSIGSASGFALGGAFGTEMILSDDISVRTEAEIGIGWFSNTEYWAHGVIEEDIRPLTFMANFYIDLMTSQKIRPYIGVGVGNANINFNITNNDVDFGSSSISFSDSTFTFGLYAGLAFNMNEEGTIVGDIGVRHLMASMMGMDISQTTINFGTRFMF